MDRVPEGSGTPCAGVREAISPAARRLALPVVLNGLLLVTASCALVDDAAADGQAGFVRIGPRAATGQWASSVAAPVEQPPAAAPAPEGPLSLAIQEAILIALENNRQLSVQRLNPPIRQTTEEERRAVFDPLLSGRASWSRQRYETSSGGSTGTTSAATEKAGAEAALEQSLPTGTGVKLSASTDRTASSLSGRTSAATRLGLTVTQSLLRGFGSEVNLASLRQARLDTRISEYELRGFAEALVAQVENTCWGYALAGRQIAIFEDSLKLAEQQLAETEERILVGTLAEVERAAAQAEVAQRREALIKARATLATTRLQLLRLLNVPGGDLYQREIAVREEPQAPSAELEDASTHVAVALLMRPDLNQARLGVQRGVLEVVKTRNGLLPKLDLFLTLGKSGYADSFTGSGRDLDGDSYDVLFGVALERPVGNRAAEARHRRATLSRRQAEEALGNLEQLVELDVRSAYIDVEQAREQIAATAATRAFREEAVRAETEKFRVGKSTTYLVGQAQRDLVASQIAEVQAAVNYRKALVDFHRLEGSLLARRGIAAPGDAPPGGIPSPLQPPPPD